MELTVLTIAFDPVRKTFPREELEDFCINKKIHQVESQFFQEGAVPYWTVMIRYERLTIAASRQPSLTQEEQGAFDRLRIWRKEKALAEGFPAYLIATNRQLAEMIQRRVRSQAGFEGIKGFGRKRTQKYGKDIIHILTKYFENG